MVWKKENSREKYDPQIRFVLSAGLGASAFKSELKPRHIICRIFPQYPERVEYAYHGDSRIGEDGCPDVGEPDEAEDHYQQLYEQRYDDILNCYGASAAGDGDGSRDSLHG